MLTAVSLIPQLSPDSSVVATKVAADQTPNDIGLLAGHSYQVSELFTALLTISANDAAVALTQATGSLARGMGIINAEAHHRSRRTTPSTRSTPMAWTRRGSTPPRTTWR